MGVYDEVDIPLAVAELGVGEGVEDLSVLLLDDGEDAQRLAQDRQLAGVDRELPGLRDEGEAADADDVAYVEEFLENGVVERFVFFGADFIAFDIHLYAPLLVLKFDE